MWRSWLNPRAARQAHPAEDHAVAAGDPAHKVLVYGPEAARVARLTLDYPVIETGGDLFGYWTHGGSPVISYVIGPGRGSRHHVTSFYQDEHYLHDIGTTLYDEHGLQHVGAWHSHHRLGLNQPSQGDIETVRSGMRHQGWSRFLLLITTITDPDAGPVLHNYFLFVDTRDAPEPIRILTLPAPSPFRTLEHDPREEVPRRHRDAAWQPGPFTPGARRRAEEVFKGAWFTTVEGRALLLRAARQFAAAGVDCHMLPAEDGQSLKLMLPDGALLLGRGFPATAPQWLGGEPPEYLEPWSPSTELADWYLQVRKASPPAVS